MMTFAVKMRSINNLQIFKRSTATGEHSCICKFERRRELSLIALSSAYPFLDGINNLCDFGMSKLKPDQAILK